MPKMILFLALLGLAASPPADKANLGILLGDFTLQMRQATGLAGVTGAVIQQVLPNTAAARAGLLPGDLIVGVDNLTVDGAADVIARAGKHEAGEVVTLSILRRDWYGRLQTARVRLTLEAYAPGRGGASSGGSAAPGGRSASGVSSPQGGQPPPKASLPNPPNKPGRPTESWFGAKFTGSALPVKVHFNANRTCAAMAPTDWFVYGQRSEGDAVDIVAPDGSTASWSSVGVPGFSVQYQPENATPQGYISHSLSGRLIGKNFRVTYGEPIRDEFGYIWQPFERDVPSPESRVAPAEGGRKGIVIYRVFPLQSDPLGYILVQRSVETPKQIWEQKGAQALMVTLSIRCNVQLRPSPDSIGHTPGGRGGSDDDKEESTYNQQLGMEYAHNPETGDLYWMNHGTDWHETGPQGPGYYIRSGNELKKLAEGLGR